VNLTDGLAEHAAISDDNAPVGKRTLRQDKVFVAVPANDSLELIETVTCADDGETVIEVDNGCRPWQSAFPRHDARGK
jgi:predicted dinucleotide-binding enzyme